MNHKDGNGGAVELVQISGKLRQAALGIYREWERNWAEHEKAIRARGNTVRCQPGCASCCFSRKLCTLSEGVAIIDYLDTNFSAGRFEQFRLRVESAASSLRQLRADGYCESEDEFYRAGGQECPFLEAGACVIYPVRPLDCRGLNVIDGASAPESCRWCPHAVNCIESEFEYRSLRNQLQKTEARYDPPPLPEAMSPALLPEVLSFLWEEMPPPTSLFSGEATRLRLATRGTERDETWQDDRSDFRAVKMEISLPEEGDYAEDLTLLRQRFKNHEVYDRAVTGENLPEFCTLYKRNNKCRFDWDRRKFTGWKKHTEDLPYTVWMSDGLQERLMMWEGAKRARGRVLCGGLGLGIFPQMALSLPRVESVEVVERDPHVVVLIEEAWKKKPWPRREAVTIHLSSIEEFLEATDERYDTIYIDTWDAIYNEYLPHLNELTRFARPVLRPGGEILLWAYDLMVRSYLETAQLVLERREKYLKAGAAQLRNIKTRYPMLHRLVKWLRAHPKASDDELRTAGYRIATKECRNLGLLTLSRQKGAQVLLDRKYSKGSPFLQ